MGSDIRRPLDTLCSQIATTLKRQHGIDDAVISLDWLDKQEWQSFVEGHETRFGIHKSTGPKAAVVQLFNAVIAAREVVND